MKPVLAMWYGQAGRWRRDWTAGLLALIALLGAEAPRSDAAGGPGWDFLALPQILRVAKLEASLDAGTVTGIQAVDLNGDGRNDLAVAWYATDNDNPAANLRYVSIYIAEGAGFRLACRLNLYVYNSGSPSLSVFRFGTGAMTAGDFDGDGDIDLAVTAFYGDELYFIENLGDETFVPHLQFMFGSNSPGNLVTPPEMVSADFDGDGRDEVAYIVDPSLYPEGDIVHFWRTERGISDMYRALDWCAFGGDLVYQWTRSLAVADFDGDGRPDLVFTAIDHEEGGDLPVFTIWHGFDPATERFKVFDTFPGMSCSDVVAVPAAQPDCAPGVVLSDLDGTKLQYWAPICEGTLGFCLMAEVSGYAGLAPNKGMAIAAGDLDGDGQPDVVTKQLRGNTTDGNQIELTSSTHYGAYWVRSDPTPISTLGLATQTFNGILRPHNLVVADLHGDSRPEIVAGFAASYNSEDGSDDARAIKVAIWEGHAAAVDEATYLEWRNSMQSVEATEYESQ